MYALGFDFNVAHPYEPLFMILGTDPVRQLRCAWQGGVGGWVRVGGKVGMWLGWGQQLSVWGWRLLQLLCRGGPLEAMPRRNISGRARLCHAAAVQGCQSTGALQR